VSVYTLVTRPQLEAFFDHYALGRVTAFQSIADGIDNSNYFVDTTEGSFVLTLFETLTHHELSFFIKLLTRLNDYQIPCPVPQFDKQAQQLRLLNDKPTAIFKRLQGKSVENPTAVHCQQIGFQLARLHEYAHYEDFPINCDVLNECQILFNKICDQLETSDLTLIESELAFQALHHPKDLPTGIIHADLFRDNVLFDANKLTGILDFYSAGKGAFLLDIAITVNDWCCDDGKLNAERVAAFLSAYESLRPLHSKEKQHWQTMLRAAALRFWLSRLEHKLNPRAGETVQQKDPLYFRQILQHHRQIA
jgi:homoserine kinase type II